MTKRFRIAAIAVFSLLVAGTYAGLSRAQQPVSAPDTNAFRVAPDRGAAGMSRWLRALQTRASLMLFTAHPDDEDGGMLAYESRGLGARAGADDAESRRRRAERHVAGSVRRARPGAHPGTADGRPLHGRRPVFFPRHRLRIFEDARRSARKMGPRPRSVGCRARCTDDASAGGDFGVRGRGQPTVTATTRSPDKWRRRFSSRRGIPTKFPEQIREGLRPWSPLKVYARVPFFQVTAEGMYDYAIDKFVPVRFFDYVNQKWSNEGPQTTLEIPEGLAAPAPG